MSRSKTILRRLLSYKKRVRRVISGFRIIFVTVPLCVMPFRVMLFCAMPFRVMPFSVMPFRVMPFSVMPFSVMPFSVMPVCVMTVCKIGLLPFSFGLMHVQFG